MDAAGPSATHRRLSLRQFARAVRADQKWVQNSARLLGVRLRYTRDEALWLGLARLLNESFHVPLETAASMARTGLDPASPLQAEREGTVTLATSCDGSARVTIDVARYQSTFAFALAGALELETPQRRGRRPPPPRRSGSAIARAQRQGIDVGFLRFMLRLLAGERLSRLEMNAPPIGAERRPRRGR